MTRRCSSEEILQAYTKGLSIKVKENELSLGYDPMFINNRTGLRGITISTNTQLFFPVSNIHFVVTDRHEVTELNTSYDCRVVA